MARVLRNGLPPSAGWKVIVRIIVAVGTSNVINRGRHFVLLGVC